jgi:NAD(P)-dependent dehydrogenase (short-subunit alcohol dehydrogenase family)
MANRFQDKVVLIVGGNSGIGLATARAFAAEGAKLVITGRDPATLAAAAGETGAEQYRTDIADVRALDPVVEAIRDRHGRIDILFVNAGVGGFRPVREVTPELWDEIQDINLKGAFFAVQKALPLMGQGGSIVVTGSIGSVMGIPGNVIYAASKAGFAPRCACSPPSWSATASVSTWSAPARPRRRSSIATRGWMRQRSKASGR